MATQKPQQIIIWESSNMLKTPFLARATRRSATLFGRQTCPVLCQGEDSSTAENTLHGSNVPYTSS